MAEESKFPGGAQPGDEHGALPARLRAARRGPGVDDVRNDFTSVEDVVRLALGQEKAVTAQITALARTAGGGGPRPADDRVTVTAG